jgi:hypothetical protein
MGSVQKPPVRVGGASGGFSDRVHAITQLAQNGECDVIVGDWLSEMTMTVHGAGKIKALSGGNSKSKSLEEQLQGAMVSHLELHDSLQPSSSLTKLMMRCSTVRREFYRLLPSRNSPSLQK